MNGDDPLARLIELGYTAREAGFLHRVGRFSGYFLRRQYSQFLYRERGALQHQFLRKALGYGHLEILVCSRNHHLYHLKSRSVYGRLGIENSQSRRLKGDDDIKIRLMTLDYVLSRSCRQFLATDDEKIREFEMAKIRVSELPTCLFRNPNTEVTTVRYFSDGFPIAVLRAPDRLIEFTYFDHGTCTLKPFLRHLNSYKPLLLALGKFRFVYVGDSHSNFSAATAMFHNVFATADDGSNRTMLPFGLGHLIEFFEAQRTWDSNSPDLTTHHVKILREGEKAYRRSEHSQLCNAWHAGRAEFEQKLRELGVQKNVTAAFETYFLRHEYPLSVGNSVQKLTNRAVYAAV